MKLVIQSDAGDEVLTYEYEEILKLIEELMGKDVAEEFNKIADQLKKSTRNL